MDPQLTLFLNKISHPLLSLFASAFGAAMLYSKWGKSQLRPYVFADIVDTFALSETTRIRIEFVVFILVGMITCMILTQPANPQQAFAAGLGWTGLLTDNTSRRSKSSAKPKGV